MNVTDHQSIEVGQGSCEAGDFAEALWCILAEDFYHYDLPVVDDDERMSGLISSFRSNFHVEVLLSIFSTSITGHESHAIGRTREKNKNGTTVFWATDAGDILANLAPKPGESLPDVVAHIMRICGRHLHQFSETVMFNYRPDLVNQDDLMGVVNQMIHETTIDWDYSSDDVESTDYFVTQYDQK